MIKTLSTHRLDLCEDRRPLTHFVLLILLVRHTHVPPPCILALKSWVKVKLILRRPVRTPTSWEQSMADTPKETVLAVRPFQDLRKGGRLTE
jgi:hypothetical protein